MTENPPPILAAWARAYFRAWCWNDEFPDPCLVRIRKAPRQNRRTFTRGRAFVKAGHAVIRIRGDHEPRRLEDLQPIPPEISHNC